MEQFTKLAFMLLLILSIASFVKGYIVNKQVERTIDISSQLVKESVKIVIKSSGLHTVNYIFVVPEEKSKALAFISAKDELNKDLELKENIGENHGNFSIILQNALKAQMIFLEITYTKDIIPHPAEIKQSDKQLVKYSGNLYFFSPYKTILQNTFIKLSSSHIISHTQIKPFLVTSNKINYGPFEDVGEYSNQNLVIHYENESPFLTVKYLERTIEVSHWGNIAVRESIYMDHSGAKLKGSFSRYEFQKDGRSSHSAVKSYKTVLPSSATDVFYRDSNGNISTSNMQILREYVELELRPRFPLFGGWKNHYILGYNVPSFEYLFNSNENYLLKMRLIDHIHDDMVIDEVLVKIILPEGATNIQLTTPYPVKRNDDDFFFTYLDIIGRPIISFKNTNLIENHILDFKLNYTFSIFSLLQEPLLVTAFIFFIFVLTIVFLRLDFSITSHHKD